MDYLADTVFLIDLWREKAKSGPAMSFARQHEASTICINWVVLGEFLSGCTSTGHKVDASFFLGRYPVIHSTEAMVRTYAELHDLLRRKNSLPGSNDLWIAASALATKLPLLTRNRRDFDSVPGLNITDYSTVAP